MSLTVPIDLETWKMQKDALDFYGNGIVDQIRRNPDADWGERMPQIIRDIADTTGCKLTWKLEVCPNSSDQTQLDSLDCELWTPPDENGVVNHFRRSMKVVLRGPEIVPSVQIQSRAAASLLNASRKRSGVEQANDHLNN